MPTTRLTRTERALLDKVLVALAPRLLDGHRLAPEAAAHLAAERALALISERRRILKGGTR